MQEEQSNPQENQPSQSQDSFVSTPPPIEPETVTSSSKLTLGLSIILVLIFGVGGYLMYAQNSSTNNHEPVACTADAKICPDGSSVGRVGPDCQFAECPVQIQIPEGQRLYKNDEYNFYFLYPESSEMGDWRDGTGGGIIIFTNLYSSADIPDGIGNIKVYIKNPESDSFEDYVHKTFYDFHVHPEYGIRPTMETLEGQKKWPNFNIDDFRGMYLVSDELYEELGNARGSRFTFDTGQSKNGLSVLKHKRNFSGWVGSVYEVEVWVNKQAVLIFSSEVAPDVIDQIVDSIHLIVN